MFLVSMQTPPPSYLPYEFTYEGMLERVIVYLENQDFCTTYHHWPPNDTISIKISNEDESCKDACYREGIPSIHLLYMSHDPSIHVT